MRKILWMVPLLLVSALSISQAGSPVRYALVIGNNHGAKAGTLNLPNLEFAESEALQLSRVLVAHGNWDATSGRLKVLTGKSRAEILKAASELAEQHRKDRELLGEVPTLFVFFFTGHGLEGKLLTSHEPLSGMDIAWIFKEIGASFTVGVFDACYSGSLDLESLKRKGLRTTPGFNIFEEMPREILNSSGTVWFTSSRPDQVSYEDSRFGGVFTHFFIEAMQRAKADDFGISLENIWNYARSHTISHTQKTGRPQTPQKIIRDMTSTGPMYFSFSQKRAASLVFDSEIEGSFLIRYGNGHLTEKIEKHAGKVLTVPIYTGELILEKLASAEKQRTQGHRKNRQLVQVEKGARIRIAQSSAWQAQKWPGYIEEQLSTKGGQLDDMVVCKRSPNLDGSISLDYRAAFGPQFAASVTHNPTLSFRLDRDWLNARLRMAYGRKSQEFSSWGYNLERSSLGVEAGPAFELGTLRLAVVLSLSLAYREITYRDGQKTFDASLGLGTAISLLIPLVKNPLPIYLDLVAGADLERLKPVAPVSAVSDWDFVPWVGLGLGVEIF